MGHREPFEDARVPGARLAAGSAREEICLMLGAPDACEGRPDAGPLLERRHAAGTVLRLPVRSRITSAASEVDRLNRRCCPQEQ